MMTAVSSSFVVDRDKRHSLVELSTLQSRCVATCPSRDSVCQWRACTDA